MERVCDWFAGYGRTSSTENTICRTGRRHFAILIAFIAIVAVLLTAVVASFVFPGSPPTQPATLSVTGTLDTTNETTIFRGQVEMRGRTEGSTFDGVEVRFHDATGTQFQTVAIGTLKATNDDTDAWKQAFNATLSESPHRVTVSYESFSNAAERPVETVGLALRNGQLVLVTSTPT